MTTIKELSGKILLYLYNYQQQNLVIDCDILVNPNIHSSAEREYLAKNDYYSEGQVFDDLMEISEKNYASLLNALKYLSGKGFIEFSRIRRSQVGDSAQKVVLTADGVDIIEGITRDDDSRKSFNITFNIKLADNVTVESLMKNEFGLTLFNKLFGIGLN